MNAKHRAQKHPTHRQEAQTQNQRQGQTISVCEMPETQPEARKDSGTVVLSAVPGCVGRMRCRSRETGRRHRPGRLRAAFRRARLMPAG